MGWLKRLLFGSDEDGAVEEAADGEAGGVEVEEVAPQPSHREILMRVRREAEADAIRHAEDMVNRDFPIVNEAERIADARLANLKVSYSGQRGEMGGRIQGIEGAIGEAKAGLAETERALAGKGVPESELGIEPLREPPPLLERALIGLAGAGAIVILIAVLDLRGELVAPLAAVAVAALALALALPPGPYLEDPEIAALREARKKQATKVAELEEELRGASGALTALEERTLSTAELEVKFAGEIVGAYESAVFSSLPVGVLEGGKKIKEQRAPQVRLPRWTSRLAGAE
jgi:hypothetical protein